MRHEDVSIIIVAYKARQALTQCLRSLRLHAIGSDVIVADNGREVDLAKAVHAELPNARYLPMPENVGFAAACNAGVRASDRELLLLLNPDTELEPGALDTLCGFMAAHPEVACVGPRLLNTDGSLQPSAHRFPGLVSELTRLSGAADALPRQWMRNSPRLVAVLPSTGHFDSHDTSRKVDQVTGACMLLRRDCYEQVGGMDESFFLYYEEIDLCRRLRASGWDTWHVPAARVVHHLGRSTCNEPERAWQHRHRSRLLYFRKHHLRGARLTLRGAMAVSVLAGAVVDVGRRLTGSRGVGIRRRRRMLGWCINGVTGHTVD